LQEEEEETIYAPPGKGVGCAPLLGCEIGKGFSGRTRDILSLALSIGTRDDVDHPSKEVFEGLHPK